VRIEDAGSRLNLNALIKEDDTTQSEAETFLIYFFEKVIEEMRVTAEEKNYDPAELARNLIDYVDTDGDSPSGDLEDDYYQLQSPPYRAANRPLLSVDELGLVKGFDRALVDAIRPYVTVYPYLGGGINPNTAPSHVLAALYHGTSGDYRLTNEEEVRRILEMRDGDMVFCKEAEGDLCITLGADFGTVYPPPSYTADVFQVSAEARYGDVRRTIEAVIDRSDPAEPLVLSWRVR
jgi:general secretion pathway protein K